MNALRTIRLVVELVLVGGLALAVVVQQRELTRLRAQVTQGEQDTHQTPINEPDTQPASSGGAGQGQSQSGEDPEKERSELLRLRSEVTRLRGKESELAAFQRYNTNLLVQVQELRNRLMAANAAQQNLAESTLPDAPPMKAYVGIQITTVQNDPSLNGRVIVSGVMDNSPAAEAKLQEGDVVLSVNGEAITNLVQLRTITGSSLVGQPLVFDLLRDNNAAQITVIPKPPPQELLNPRPQVR